MLIRFYFDFSDYRSYLMLDALHALKELPFQTQWIAVDAFSLRALSGAARPDTNAEHAYLRQEAVRFAASRHIPFIWQSERIRSGHALKAAVWLMKNAPHAVESFSRRLLTELWAQAHTPDIALVKTALDDLLHDNDIIDTIFSDVATHEGFVYQDACLQQALSDGVFDVPGVVMNKTLFCRFDQGELMKRELLKTALAQLSEEALLSACVDLIMDMPSHARRDAITSLLATNREEAATLPAPRQSVAIKPQIVAPQTGWKLPKTNVRSDLVVRSVAAPKGSVYPFADVVDDAPDNALTLVSQTLEFTSQKAMLQVLRTAPAGRTILARIRDGATQKLLFARTGDSDHELALLDDETPFLEFNIKTWKCLAVTASASKDIHVARIAAHHGIHAIVRIPQSDDDPSSEAWGLSANTWVAELADTIQIVDSEASRLALKTGADFRLTSTYRLKQAHVWNAPAPRTILLTEHPITLGTIAAGANLELSCRVQNLEVTTGLQNCELSSSRTSERLRIGEHLIQVIPLSGEQICIPELVTHKILDTLSRAHAESIPLLVNYWNDIEFDALEILRPLHATLVSTWHIPMVIVVLNQIVEVWQCSAQGTAYRIEKENDCFTLDLDESPKADLCFERMIARLDLTADAFLKRVDFT